MWSVLGYLKLMGACVALAVVGVLGCLVFARLAITPTAARAAQRLAGAISGSVAGVLSFQLLLTLPACALLFGALKALQNLLGPLDGPAQVAWNVTVILLFCAFFIIGTGAGFVVGGALGTRVAGGMPVAQALARSRVLSAVLNRIPLVRMWIAT